MNTSVTLKNDLIPVNEILNANSDVCGAVVYVSGLSDSDCRFPEKPLHKGFEVFQGDARHTCFKTLGIARLELPSTA
jgi:hypothetical protein